MSELAATLQLLFHWVVQQSWQAGVLVGLIVLAQILFRSWLSATWTHMLWWLVILRLLIPVVPESPLSVFQFVPPTPPLLMIGSPNAGHHIGTTPAVDPGLAYPEYNQTVSAEEQTRVPVRLVVAVWIIVALALAGRALILHFRNQRMLRRLRPVSADSALRLLDECKLRLCINREVRLLEADVGTPGITGAMRPAILLPRRWREEIDSCDLRFALLHELAHLKRHDLTMHHLVTMLCCLHWFNPLMWFAVRQIRCQREGACDEYVLARLSVGDRQSYGHALLNLVTRSPRLPATALALGSPCDSLRDRIARIVRYKTPGLGSRTLAGSVALLLVVITSVADSRIRNTEVVFSIPVVPSAFTRLRARELGIPVKTFPQQELKGVLYHPKKTKPAPAIVMLHDCRGIEPYTREWATLLAEAGYVILQVGVAKTNTECLPEYDDRYMRRTYRGDSVQSAYNALAYLAQQPTVDASRVAIMGWTQGAVLGAVLQAGTQHFYEHKFATAVAISPDCGVSRDAEFYAPILVLIGERDDWTPVKYCRRLAANRNAQSAPLELHVYPTAGHGFDNPAAGPGVYLAGVQNWYKTPARGATLAYDHAAHQDAIARVQTWLAKYLM